MPLIADNLLAENGGIIEAGFFFPGVAEADVLARLTNYLAEGYTYVVETGYEDAAARAHAYVKALNAVITRLALRPATQTVQGEVSVTRTSEQLRALQAQAAYWQGLFDSYLPVETEAETIERFPTVYSLRRADV